MWQRPPFRRKSFSILRSCCHNDERSVGQSDVSRPLASDVSTGANMEQWEKILRMTTRGNAAAQPARSPHPPSAQASRSGSEASLDRYADGTREPRAAPRFAGSTAPSTQRGARPARRRCRCQHANCRPTTPATASTTSQTCWSVSPTLMDRYLAVAGKLSRLATGLGRPAQAVRHHLHRAQGRFDQEPGPALVR